jgi:phenylacetate-CoA ligase
VLFVEEGADLERRLGVRVELAPGVAAGDELAQRVQSVLLRELRRLNSEYGAYVPPEWQPPRVHLHPHGDPAWFPPGVKHRWVAP